MTTSPQRQTALQLLRTAGIVRLCEFLRAGITAATVSRMTRDRTVVRLSRGLYQLPETTVDARHSLAEVAKRLPRAVICLTSALSMHGLTDQLPATVWVAIGPKDRAPRARGTPIRIARFSGSFLSEDVETHVIEGVSVRIFGATKTIADCFRHRRSVGLTVALEGLQAALKQRKATPSDISHAAARGGVATIMRPYLEALTTNA